MKTDFLQKQDYLCRLEITNLTTDNAWENHIRTSRLDFGSAGWLAESVRRFSSVKSAPLVADRASRNLFVRHFRPVRPVRPVTDSRTIIFTVASKHPHRHRVSKDAVGEGGCRERSADRGGIGGQEVGRTVPGIEERLYS